MFLQKFRRITTSGEYIPEIDGLRFIAIISVILFHIGSTVKTTMLNTDFDFFITSIYANGWQGVELFFVISGFIIGLPFAKQYLNGQNNISVKRYFLRRLTRLEPPYILSLIFFLIILLATNQTTFEKIIPSFLASVFYLNNIIFNDQNYLIMTVIWSLEIEVQFYVIAILLSKLFKLEKLTRRILFLIIIIGLPIVHVFYYPKMPTIYLFLHFFMLGFLLVDLYLDKEKYLKNKQLSFFVGFLSLIIIIYVNHKSNLAFEYIYLLCIFIFYYLTLTNNFWKRIMSTEIIAIIGGMCYTIYLLHSPFVSAFSRISHLFVVSEYYVVNLLFNTMLMLPVVLIISGVYFLLIEKPCMDKNWPNKLMQNIKNIGGKTKSH